MMLPARPDIRVFFPSASEAIDSVKVGSMHALRDAIQLGEGDQSAGHASGLIHSFQQSSCAAAAFWPSSRVAFSCLRQRGPLDLPALSPNAAVQSHFFGVDAGGPMVATPGVPPSSPTPVTAIGRKSWPGGPPRMPDTPAGRPG